MKKEVKDLQDWAAVQRLRSKGCSITDIAKQLHMSRTTVYTLLKKKEEPTYTRHSYPSKVEKYSEQIIEWRYSSRYGFNGTRIYRELKKLGYKGSISPIYLFLTGYFSRVSSISITSIVFKFINLIPLVLPIHKYPLLSICNVRILSSNELLFEV